jgi:pimeloyl-ACP methyl ester carboxylesterase
VDFPLTAHLLPFPDNSFNSNDSKTSQMIKPFYVRLPEDSLKDLKARLANTRWPDELKNSGWTNGTNLSYLKELCDYWLKKFDWRKTENEINAYPNFIADIESHKIHFMHIKGKANHAVPLIISHGWPGSFLEMMKIIPLLTSDEIFSFDLVIPSLPGFGFSDRITKPGCNSAFVAGIWHKLMLQLGYEKYGAQGGDIGAGVSTWLSLQQPEHMLGLHLNFISGSYQPFITKDETLSDEVKTYKNIVQQWREQEGAYSHLHATKPNTQAYGLNDSPVGLCAWLIEKFHSWSDNNGNIENAFTKDELLSNVTLYWLTQTTHSSMRIYKENSMQPLIFGKDDFVHVPVGFAKFPKELPVPPRSYIEKGFNIRQWNEMSAGGHFAAMEQPLLLAEDITAFFKLIDKI